MNDIATLLTSFDVSVIYAVSHKLADAVGMLLIADVVDYFNLHSPDGDANRRFCGHWKIWHGSARHDVMVLCAWFLLRHRQFDY